MGKYILEHIMKLHFIFRYEISTKSESCSIAEEHDCDGKTDTDAINMTLPFGFPTKNKEKRSELL